MTEPTARQAQALDFIREHIASRGFAPSVAEIGAHLNVSSNAANDLLVALQKKGYIRRAYGVARGLALAA